MSKAEDLSRQYVMPFLDKQYEKYGEHKQMELSRFDGYDMMSAYEEGYHQAEKDLELTWEDIREIYSILLNVQEETNDDYLLTLSIPERIENEYREYKETLKRYFEWKSNKTVQQRVKEEAE